MLMAAPEIGCYPISTLLPPHMRTENNVGVPGAEDVNFWGLLQAVVEAANLNGGGSLANVDLSGVEQLLLAAVSKDGTHLRFASPALKDSREMVQTACDQNGYALEYASPALRGDREVVATACHRHGFALGYASAALRDDREMVMTACTRR